MDGISGQTLSFKERENIWYPT